MKKLTREVVTEEITGYEAIDGTWFRTENECREYEESAKFVTYKIIEPYIVGRTDCCDLYLGNGYDGNVIDIIFIENLEILKMLNQYRVLCNDKVKIIGEDSIGKTLLICWDEDHCWSWPIGTIDGVLDTIRKVYEGAMFKKDEEDKGETT